MILIAGIDLLFKPFDQLIIRLYRSVVWAKQIDTHILEVFESSLDIIAAAGHIIELCPEGGDQGGHLL